MGKDIMVDLFRKIGKTSILKYSREGEGFAPLAILHDGKVFHYDDAAAEADHPSSMEDKIMALLDGADIKALQVQAEVVMLFYPETEHRFRITFVRTAPVFQAYSAIVLDGDTDHPRVEEGPFPEHILQKFRTWAEWPDVTAVPWGTC